MASSFFLLELFVSLVFPKVRKVVVLISLVLVFFSSLFAYIKGIDPAKAKEIQISLTGYPEHLTGFSIAQLSDLHLKPSTPISRLEKIVQRTNALNPDLIVLTGDVVGGLNKGIEKFAKILDKLDAEFGVFAVYGNNEFNNSGRNFEKLLKQTSIQVLRNEHIRLSNGIQVAGIDDPKGQKNIRINAGPDLDKALKKIDPHMPVILLSHKPDIFDSARKFGIDIQISGHTHAGQIPPLSLLCQLYYKYPYGLYSVEGAYLYTSSGAGTWPYLPMRLFSSNEIVLIRINTTARKN